MSVTRTCKSRCIGESLLLRDGLFLQPRFISLKYSRPSFIAYIALWVRRFLDLLISFSVALTTFYYRDFIRIIMD